jgi:hypothetical protein
MKKFYPQAAALYLQKAELGWQFLINAIAKYGKAGAYQKITFYSDDWTHDDELAWAAAALFVATGGAQYQTQLFQWFPNPADSSTFRWGWWRMSEGWGNAIRTYAFAARAAGSRRAPSTQFPRRMPGAGRGRRRRRRHLVPATTPTRARSPRHKGRPRRRMVLLARPGLRHGGRLPDQSQARVHRRPRRRHELRRGEQPGQCDVPHRPRPQAPARERQPVRPELAPDPAPLGHPARPGHGRLRVPVSYGPELSELSYPRDSGSKNVYPYYDRWSDAFNVTQEFITVNQARGFMATAFLATLTPSSGGAWSAPAATIAVPSRSRPERRPLHLERQVPGST